MKHLNRRSFFQSLFGVLGLAAAPALIKNEIGTVEPSPISSLLQSNDPNVHIYQSQSQEISASKYGDQFLANIQSLRRKYLESGKLHSIKIIADQNSASREIRKYVVMNFSSAASKKEYIQEHNQLWRELSKEHVDLA